MLTLFPAPPLVRVDWARLQPGSRPPRYLVAPAGFCTAVPDRVAPVFAAPPVAVIDALARLVDAAPRTERRAASDDGLEIDWLVRSRLFGFPDSVTARAIPAAGGATLAVYSRSHIGYADLGVNRKRVTGWLDTLATARPAA